MKVGGLQRITLGGLQTGEPIPSVDEEDSSASASV